MTEKIKLPAYLRETFYKKNLQIDSLGRLPREVQEKVLSGKSPILLFHRGKGYPARIKKAEGDRVLLEFSEGSPGIQVHENLVGVISSPKERYIFQGPVQLVKDRLVGLRIVSPRVEMRFELRDERMVFLTPLPLEIFEPLLAGKYFLLRDTNLSRDPQELQKIEKGYVYDLLLDETENVSDAFEKLLRAPGLSFVLKDISAGGARIYARKLFSLQDPLPLYLRGVLEGNGRHFSFGLLGMSREITIAEGQTKIRIMWVKRLPLEIQNFIRAVLGA